MAWFDLELRTLLAARFVDLLVVAAPPGPQCVADVQRLVADLPGDTRLVAGGATRQESVACGLTAVAAGTGLVLVHDVARPFVPDRVISAVVEALLAGASAVVPVVPIADTVRRTRDRIEGKAS